MLRPEVPDWPLSKRLAWVAAFRRAVAANIEPLAAEVQADTGKPVWQTIASDLLPLLAACKWHERRAKKVLRPRGLKGRPLWLASTKPVETRAPVGSVAIIATWNYPLQLLGVQLVQALVAGNSVTVKPSERAPRSQAMLLELAQAPSDRRRLPAGALSVVDATREAGEALLRDNNFDHVVFTGSTGVGREIAQALAPSLTPSTLELSGRDSAFVLADADCKRAAAALWQALTVNAGQTCMAPRRVLVERSALAAFEQALAPFAAGARPVRLIDAAAASRTFSLCEQAIAAGGRSLSGLAEPPVGRDLRPLAIVDCPADADLVAGEHFGPAFAVVPVDSVDQAIDIHRRCDQHLATSIFTRSNRRARSLAPRLGVAAVTVNDCVLPTAHPAVPVGGIGASGWGHSQGEQGLRAVTHAVTVSRTGAIRPPADPPSPARAQQMARAARFLYGGHRGKKLSSPRPASQPATTSAEQPPQAPVTSASDPAPSTETANSSGGLA
ncbi:MAG: aldehyde dehydrogenase family protein [Planctomycetota bacterium]